MKYKLNQSEIVKLQRLEESLWQEATRFDRTYMEQILAEDFFEFGRSGRIYRREETLDAQGETIRAVIPLANFRVRPISKNVIQVTYDSEVAYGKIVEFAHRSSLWSKNMQSWTLEFHQGTPYDPERSRTAI